MLHVSIMIIWFGMRRNGDRLGGLFGRYAENVFRGLKGIVVRGFGLLAGFVS